MAVVSDLEREYTPSSRAGGSAAPFVADYQARSAAAAAQLGGRVEAFAAGGRLVRSGPDSPLLVFIHGGYWQALSAADSMYLAPGAVAAGWSFAAIEYTVAPEGTLAQMVRECASALAELAQRGPWSHVVLAGHSAGAHLAAMVGVSGVAPIRIDRLVLISGVFDLRPLVHTTVNEPLGLDLTSASAFSPALLPLAALPDTVVAWAENDTESFKAQSHVMAARMRVAGANVVELESPARHHFDLVDDLVDFTRSLGATALGTSNHGGTA